MINYDFGQFLNSVKHLDYEDILLTTEQQITKASDKGKNKDLLIFVDKLRAFLNWLQTCEKPENFHQAELEQLKAICKGLVGKKQIKMSCLAMLKKVPAKA